jgi:ribosomal protein S12 methylthiotransferase
METQAKVAAGRARAQVGRLVDVLVENEADGLLVGRTRTQAPEIDGVIHLRGAAAPGDLVTVRVTGADTYDLRGRIVTQNLVDTALPRL